MLKNACLSFFRVARKTRKSRVRNYASFVGVQIQKCERRDLLSAITGPVSIEGTSGDDVIKVTRVTASSTDIMVSVNGALSGPFRPVGPVVINGLEGRDRISVAADVSISAIIDGGPGSDVIFGGMGDDTIHSRDGVYDRVNGGGGLDRALTDSADVVASVETLNPISTTPSNQAKSVKVLVMNYEPRIPTEDNQTLWELFGWSNPRNLAAGYELDIERASGGAVDLQVVEWRDLNEFPAFEDGYRYSPAEYVQNRRTDSNWHEGSIDFPRIVRDNGIAELIDSGTVDEVWFFADHFFIPGGESWMAGPEAFYINGPVFQQVETHRAFACMGFSYERGVAEMLHNTGHRTESTMNRIYGGWNLESPTTNWDKFSANVEQSNGVAGVGTTHYPANAVSDYDTTNSRTVQSWADDFLNYPDLTGTTKPVNRTSWGKGAAPDYERDYQKWYFAHLPRAASVNADGKQNNWWKYLYDFNNYTATGAPKPLAAASLATSIYNTGSSTYTFSVAFSGAIPIDVSLLDSQDFRVTGPNGFDWPAELVKISDDRDDTHVVATYRITAPGGTWDAADFGTYEIRLQEGAVANTLRQTLAAGILDSFLVGTASTQALPADDSTELKLAFDGNTNGVAGETAAETTGLTFVPGRIGQAVQTSVNGSIVFTNAGNISASEGTIEFWIKPNWNGAGNTGNTFFQVGELFNNGLLLSIDGAENLRFIRWGDDPTTSVVEVDYETGVAFNASNWVAGEWHHFAATWNNTARQQALYIDGRLVASITDATSFSVFAGTQMLIGRNSGGGSFADAAFEEFRISSRARSAKEISNSFLSGSEFSSLSVIAVKNVMMIGNQQPLRATAVGPDGRTWDVTHLVQWTSSNATVVAVDDGGGVIANKAGSAIISARLTNLVSSKTFSVSNPSAPIATFTTASVSTFGGTHYDVSVRYTDNTGVLVSSLDDADLHVTGPNGFSGFLTLLSKTPTLDSKSVTAVYRLFPRGGYWDASDNGVYQVTILPGQIHDIQGRTNGRRFVSEFHVAIPPEILTPPATTDTRRPLIQWNAVPGAVGYKVRVYFLDAGKSEILTASVDVPRFLPPTSLAVGNYEVQVRSEHSSGFFSEWSTASSFQIINQHMGTTAGDAFVVTFISGAVKITQASGGGAPVSKGAYPLTVPIKFKGLTSADSVKVVGTKGNDVFSVSAAGLTVNGVQIIVDGSAKMTFAGATGDDVYRFDADSALGSFTLDESGGGNDTLDFSMTSLAGVTVNLGIGTAQKVHPDNLRVSLGSASSFENVIGGSASDNLKGNGSANRIRGGGGHDILNGAGGNDSLIGGSGNDTLVGGPGDDLYIFTTAASNESDSVVEATNGGIDTLNFAALTTAVSINLGTVTSQAVHTNRRLRLSSASSIENVMGGSAGDNLTGNSLANVMVGNDGGDQLSGGAGRDILVGGTGLDTINGGAEDDILIAGRTTVDQVLSRLIDVSKAWRSGDTYSTRLTKIRGGVGPSVTSLKAKINVLTDHAQVDSLSGGEGTDWYFLAINDVLSGQVSGEIIDRL